jgi:2-methylcitrate dehydratase PrpD
LSELRLNGPADCVGATGQGSDYNLKYLIAAALVDGQVGPEQPEPSRIRAADAKSFWHV